MGSQSLDDAVLHQGKHYEDLRITLRLGVGVESVDVTRGRLSLNEGGEAVFDRLAIATGASALRPPLPGVDLAGVFTLRGWEDSARIAAALKTSRKAVVIGGGFIGLEAAAAARAQGLDVAVCEAQPRILSRSVPTDIAAEVQRRHEAQGIDIHLDTKVGELEGARGQVSAVRLEGGERLDADLVIVGVGAAIAAPQFSEALPTRQGGIITDGRAQTALETVMALGDCALPPHPRSGEPVRFESVQNAVDTARLAAAALVGNHDLKRPQPWFWSDQGDVKLQMAGLDDDADSAVTRPMGEGGLARFALKAGRVVAVHALNAPVAYAAGRRMVEAGAAIDKDRLADPAHSLKTLLQDALH
jgi:3-phenylpropionate/trans-cinnamate dioxygenase ferredoxin reductase subunit